MGGATANRGWSKKSGTGSEKSTAGPVKKSGSEATHSSVRMRFSPVWFRSLAMVVFFLLANVCPSRANDAIGVQILNLLNHNLDIFWVHGRNKKHFRPTSVRGRTPHSLSSQLKFVNSEA